MTAHPAAATQGLTLLGAAGGAAGEQACVGDTCLLPAAPDPTTDASREPAVSVHAGEVPAASLHAAEGEPLGQ
ncbi:MAG TPA: hypothetical protein VF143_06540 [Candidatus Nanopelagicales bacterium]